MRPVNLLRYGVDGLTSSSLFSVGFVVVRVALRGVEDCRVSQCV